MVSLYKYLISTVLFHYVYVDNSVHYLYILFIQGILLAKNVLEQLQQHTTAVQWV